MKNASCPFPPFPAASEQVPAQCDIVIIVTAGNTYLAPHMWQAMFSVPCKHSSGSSGANIEVVLSWPKFTSEETEAQRS